MAGKKPEVKELPRDFKLPEKVFYPSEEILNLWVDKEWLRIEATHYKGFLCHLKGKILFEEKYPGRKYENLSSAEMEFWFKEAERMFLNDFKQVEELCKKQASVWRRQMEIRIALEQEEKKDETG